MPFLLPAAVLLWLVVLCFDATIHAALVPPSPWHELIARNTVWMKLVRAPGNWPLVLITVLLLWRFHKESWRAAGCLALTAIVAGTLVGILKGVVGRSRPGTWPGTPEWVPFRGGWHGFWSQTNLSFVSGDAAQAFVWATVLAACVPALRWPAYAWATLTLLQRVVSGAHWPSDAVGGAILGVVTVRVMCRILSQFVAPADASPGDAVRRPAGGAAADA